MGLWPWKFLALKGQELIVTSGDSVLGADDKAGVAEIMALCERMLRPDAPDHGKICVAFTPDEEIGRGADRFDIGGFGADSTEVRWANLNMNASMRLPAGYRSGGSASIPAARKTRWSTLRWSRWSSLPCFPRGNARSIRKATKGFII